MSIFPLWPLPLPETDPNPPLPLPEPPNTNTNTAFGSNTLNSNTSGTYNTALGAYAGAKTNNSFNTYLGAQTDISGTTQISNSTAIGYNAQITASHQIVLGTISENISIPGPYVGIGTYNPTNALALDVSGNVNVSNGNISGSILTPSNQIQIQNGGTITSNYAGGSVTLLGPTATLFEANTYFLKNMYIYLDLLFVHTLRC